MSALIRLSEQLWFDTFRPVINLSSDGSGLNIDGDGYMFETNGKDLEKVLHTINSKKDCHVWTLIEGDDGLFIVDGYHLVNRQGYFITLDPVPEGSSYEIPYDD